MYLLWDLKSTLESGSNTGERKDCLGLSPSELVLPKMSLSLWCLNVMFIPQDPPLVLLFHLPILAAYKIFESCKTHTAAAVEVARILKR